MKCRQRSILVKERRVWAGTGGGSSTEGVHVDPRVAIIAPHLIAEVIGTVDSEGQIPSNIW